MRASETPQVQDQQSEQFVEDKWGYRPVAVKTILILSFDLSSNKTTFTLKVQKVYEPHAVFSLILYTTAYSNLI